MGTAVYCPQHKSKYNWITKQFIFKRTLGGHLLASFRAFSSTKSRRTALGAPPILSTKKPANPLQIWLTEYALKYELLSNHTHSSSPVMVSYSNSYLSAYSVSQI